MPQLHFNANERLFKSDLNNLAYITRRAINSGCDVVENGVPDMSVDINAGSMEFDGSTVTVGLQNVAIAAADPADDRYDLVLVDSAGVASVVTGTPATVPQTPTYDPDLYLVLAKVLVQNGVTAIYNADIIDSRCITTGLGGGGGGLASYSIAVSGSNSYTVNHNLSDSNPVVQFYDTLGELVEPQTVTVLTANSIQVDFAVSTDGTVVVHGGSFAPLTSVNGSLFIETLFPDTVSGPSQGLVGYAPSLDFPAGSATIAYNSYKIPQDASLTNDMYIVLYFTQDGTSVNDFNIDVDIKIKDIGDDLTSADTLNLSDTPTPTGVANELQSVTFTIPNANLSALTELIALRVTRDGATDTNVDNFQLVNVEIQYTRGS